MENLIVLVVDDQEDIQNILSDRLTIHGYQVSVASNGLEAFEMVDRIFPDLILLDIMLPDTNGMDILAKIKQEYPEIIVIMITAHGTIQIAVEAMKLGAYDFIEKPFNNLDEVRIKVDNALKRKAMIMENQYLRSELKGKYSDIMGKSPKIMEVLHNIDKVAPSDLTVLITGETGTGKELVARALHENSLRSSKEFVVANCTADTLFESYLFGHEKGSFTGATSRKLGKMDFAEGGTIFLDEIGAMPFDLQSKLLRLIQFKEFERVGGTLIKADVRFIAATNQDLNDAIKDGKFRLDLFHRFKFNIKVPPLTEIKEDIPILVEHFIQKYSTVNGKKIIRIADEVMQLLINYSWPGNIRELQNCFERMIFFAEHETISVDDLPQEIRDAKISESTSTYSGPGIFIKPGTSFRNAQKMLILKTLKDADGNKTRTAKLLEMNLRTLHNKLKDYSGDQ
ncbi:MAG: sigma-54 dependent transcriptional regulator [Candidatus Poribacteria bacterium]